MTYRLHGITRPDRSDLEGASGARRNGARRAYPLHGITRLGRRPSLRKLLGYEEAKYSEFRWTKKRSAYEKGAKFMVLDETGYHDAVIEVVDPRIFVDFDGKEHILVKQFGTDYYHAENLKRGKIQNIHHVYGEGEVPA